MVWCGVAWVTCTLSAMTPESAPSRLSTRRCMGLSSGPSWSCPRLESAAWPALPAAGVVLLAPAPCDERGERVEREAALAPLDTAAASRPLKLRWKAGGPEYG